MTGARRPGANEEADLVWTNGTNGGEVAHGRVCRDNAPGWRVRANCRDRRSASEGPRKDPRRRKPGRRTAAGGTEPGVGKLAYAQPEQFHFDEPSQLRYGRNGP